MQCTTKCWLLAMNQYFHPLCHYASPWCPSFMFSKTQTNPPQEKRLQKSGHCKLFLFFRIVNINIKTKFREPISLGLEAISLTLLPLKSTRSQSRFVWRAFKNDFLRTTSRYITRRKMSGRLKLKEFKKTTVR